MMIPVNVFIEEEPSGSGTWMWTTAKDGTGRAWVKHVSDLSVPGADAETVGIAGMTRVVRVLLDRQGRKYKQWKDQYFTLKILELDFLPAKAPEFTHSVTPG